MTYLQAGRFDLPSWKYVAPVKALWLTFLNLCQAHLLTVGEDMNIVARDASQVCSRIVKYEGHLKTHDL